MEKKKKNFTEIEKGITAPKPLHIKSINEGKFTPVPPNTKHLQANIETKDKSSTEEEKKNK